MRVTHLNMTDPSSQCPDGFRLVTPNYVRLCIRDTSSAGCRIIASESFGMSYSQVCGYMLEDIHIVLQEHLKTAPMCYSVETMLMVSR